jgi:hypothetical protein
MIHPLFYFSSRRHLRQIGIINGGVYSIYLIIKTVSGQVNSELAGGHQGLFEAVVTPTDKA